MNTARLGPTMLAVGALASSVVARPLARLHGTPQRVPVSEQPRRVEPRVWQADVSVQTLEVTALKPGGPITTRVVVATGNDEAREVRIEMLLPVGVAILRIPGGCHASPSPVASLDARISCGLGDMPVRALRELSITTSGAARPGARLHFAVFAYSDTPDPIPANNFAERVSP